MATVQYIFIRVAAKMIRKLFLGIAMLSVTASGMAGSQTGTVENLYVRASDGLVYFALKGTAKTGSPACALIGYWMIKDENSNAGKRQYALLLAAQLAGKTVVVSGMNTCTRWADGEDVDVATIVP